MLHQEDRKRPLVVHIAIVDAADQAPHEAEPEPQRIGPCNCSKALLTSPADQVLCSSSKSPQKRSLRTTQWIRLNGQWSTDLDRDSKICRWRACDVD